MIKTHEVRQLKPGEWVRLKCQNGLGFTWASVIKTDESLHLQIGHGKFVLHYRWVSCEDGITPKRSLYIGINHRSLQEQIHRVRMFFKRVWHYRDIRETVKRINKLHETCSDIMQDPMCGCPEDFCEDWGRKASRLQWDLNRKYYL